MGIHEAGQDDFTGAVDLSDFLAVLLQPGIAQGVFGGADGNDLSAEAEDRAVFDDAEFVEVGTTAGAGLLDVDRSVSSWPMLARNSGGLIF